MSDDFSWAKILLMLAMLGAMFVFPAIVIGLNARATHRRENAPGWDAEADDR